MKKSQFSPTQIASILKEFDNGKTAEQINREHGVSKASLYELKNWKKKTPG
jgi:putative transposase